MITRFVPLLTCTAALALVAGCTSSGGPGTVVTVTKHVTAPVPHPSTSAKSTSAGAPPPPRNLTKLPGTCDNLLPDGTVFQAIGVNSLAGVDAFVVGQPEADIGRVGYLNCRYGVTGSGASAVPKIEIGISLYKTAGDAASRVSSTVADYTGHAATATRTTVDGRPATLLTGGAGAGYDEPLLVAASGQRTVAVSIASSVASGAKASQDATALAALALKNTGG